jgi:hypothetical protein
MTTIDVARRPSAAFRWGWGAFLASGVAYAAVRTVSGDAVPWSLWMSIGSTCVIFAGRLLTPAKSRRFDYFMVAAVVLMIAAVIFDRA